MNITLVIRAADPARAAQLLEVLGIELEAPNRPNPGRWHGWGRATVTIEATAPGQAPVVALGVHALDTRRERLRDALSGATLDLGGVPLELVEHEGPISRPGWDEALFPEAVTMIDAARHELRAAFAAHGLSNVRLAGPRLLGRDDAVFALIPDGADDAAVADLEEILSRQADGSLRIEVIPPRIIDPAILTRIDELAWDVTP